MKEDGTICRIIENYVGLGTECELEEPGNAKQSAISIFEEAHLTSDLY